MVARMHVGGKSARINVESRPGIEIVTLTRPEALNALDEAMTQQLLGYFSGLSERHDVRVVILRGEGRAFCAGLDLKGWINDGSRGPIHHTWRTQRMIAQVMQSMRACPQPVIGLAHGAACGGGFSMLLACDVRYAAPSARMNAAYIKIGLGGCDMGASYFLPRLVGASVAAELLLTGRFIDARRALKVNLVSEVVPEDDLLETGLRLAADMLETAPMGLRLTKDLLNINIDAPNMATAFAIEDRQQVMLSATADHQEAVAAFLEKRPPAYLDR
jgi:enoyl-CoA hydratase/carnithine racemase